jgi:hypothetical protein
MPNPTSIGPRLLVGLFAVAACAATVSAHHGWSWTQDAQTEMTGEILDIYIGPPHPRLQIRTAGEGEWQVDLGNPRQTADAGFSAGEAKVGDKVLVRGHRSAKTGERLVKAVRITVNQKQYLFYPDLLRE